MLALIIILLYNIMFNMTFREQKKTGIFNKRALCCVYLFSFMYNAHLLRQCKTAYFKSALHVLHKMNMMFVMRIKS